MLQLLRIEMFKIYRRPRTFIAFGAISAIILLVQAALRFGGKEYVGIMMSGLSSMFEAPTDQILNGYFACFMILNLLLVHVPILVALVAGDMISGEANMGTLRLLAAKPVSRTRLLSVKFIAACIYTISLLVWVAVLSLFVSMLLFGTNQLYVPRETQANIIATQDILWRYVAAFGFAGLGLITVAALSFLLSTFSDNSIGPIVGTVCVIIVFTILTQLEIPLYEKIKPYLFTTHMLGWKGFFYVLGKEGVTINGSVENPRAIVNSALVLLGYTAAFLATANWYFNKKNILS